MRAADAGIEVVFVTARPPRWLRELASHVAGHGVAICANGAAVLEVGTGRLLVERGMSPELVGSIADRVRAAWGGPEAVHLATESADGFAYETRFLSSHPEPPGSATADRIEDVLRPSTFKLLVRSTRPVGATFADELAAVVGELGIVADSGAVGLGEISGPGITKASTLADWAATRGIDPGGRLGRRRRPERPVHARLGRHLVRDGQRARVRAATRRPGGAPRTPTTGWRTCWSSRVRWPRAP